MKLTPEFLTSAAGILLNVIFTYIPGATDWFERLKPPHKALFMLGLSVVIAGVVYGANCYGWAGGLGLPEAACTQTGLVELARLLAITFASNQVAYLGTRTYSRVANQ